MDALSEILRLAHFTADVTVDATAHEPWCVSVPSSAAFSRAYLVVDGEAHLQASGIEETTLRTGDLVFLPGGEAHLLGSNLGVEARSLASIIRAPVAGEVLPSRLGGSGPPTRWIAFTFACERHLAASLLSALPPIVFVDMAGAPSVDWLLDSLALTLSHSDAPALGASAMRARLAEAVFVDALARHIHSLPPGGTGWLAGLNDRYVGRTLALIHGRPSEAWTVERLGKQVGLSRSALAERFGQVMGEPLFAFLTRWRLQLAAEFLLTSTRPITAIAREAGYESAPAFSAAFKRVFGKPPSVWRRKRRPA
jgi:AraC family transcriptional regulator, alkane utilization regulator